MNENSELHFTLFTTSLSHLLSSFPPSLTSPPPPSLSPPLPPSSLLLHLFPYFTSFHLSLVLPSNKLFDFIYVLVSFFSSPSVPFLSLISLHFNPVSLSLSCLFSLYFFNFYFLFFLYHFTLTFRSLFCLLFLLSVPFPLNPFLI